MVYCKARRRNGRRNTFARSKPARRNAQAAVRLIPAFKPAGILNGERRKCLRRQKCPCGRSAHSLNRRRPQIRKSTLSTKAENNESSLNQTERSYPIL